jgi:hypothetical protein
MDKRFDIIIVGSGAGGGTRPRKPDVPPANPKIAPISGYGSLVKQ